MTHYSTIDAPVIFRGGQYNYVNVRTGEILECRLSGQKIYTARTDPEGGPGDGGCPSDGPDPASLSTAHTTPKEKTRLVKPEEQRGNACFYLGGSLIIIKKAALTDFPKRYRTEETKRGKITTFSKGARKRMMRFMGKIVRNILPVFATVTYPEDYPASPAEWARHLEIFRKRLARKFPNFALVGRLEPQKRGAPHYHFLIWGVPFAFLRGWIPFNWCQIVGSDDPNHLKWHLGLLGHGNKHCVSECKNWAQASKYVSKYISKVQELDDLPDGWNTPGRFWFVWNEKKIPFAELVMASITNHEAAVLMRLVRRAMRKPNKNQNRLKKKIPGCDHHSLSLLCDADQWFDNLQKMIGQVGGSFPIPA